MSGRIGEDRGAETSKELLMMSRPAIHAVTELSDAEVANAAALLHEQRYFRVNQLAELSNDHAATSSTTAGAEVTGALKHAARHALAEIDLALDRLHNGRYGQCVDCGRAVGRDRLEVLPAAARCLLCQRRTSNTRPPSRPQTVAGYDNRSA